MNKDFHEQFIAPEKQWTWFISKASGRFVTHTTPSENRYIFERGQPRLIKDKRDIEYFSKHNAFRKVEADEEVIVKETIPTATPSNPIPAPQIDVEIKKKSRGRPKKDSESI